LTLDQSAGCGIFDTFKLNCGNIYIEIKFIYYSFIHYIYRVLQVIFGHNCGETIDGPCVGGGGDVAGVVQHIFVIKSACSS
jgi:hypothetical protein